MRKFKGMLNEVQARYRPTNVSRFKVSGSADVNSQIRDLWPVDIEHREAMVSVYLNQANNIVGYSVISIGSISGTLCDVKLVFQYGLLCNASSLILIHNHPSGSLNPSRADLDLTKKIKEASLIMDIRMLDHLIITKESYCSLADEGLIECL
jgi:DNA repair protein RadC